MAAESKDLFAFRRGFTDLLPNRSLDYARDDSLVRNLKQLDKLQFAALSSPILPVYQKRGCPKASSFLYWGVDFDRTSGEGVHFSAIGGSLSSKGGSF